MLGTVISNWIEIIFFFQIPVWDGKSLSPLLTNRLDSNPWKRIIGENVLQTKFSKPKQPNMITSAEQVYRAHMFFQTCIAWLICHCIQHSRFDETTEARKVVSGNILASAHGGVGYLNHEVAFRQLRLQAASCSIWRCCIYEFAFVSSPLSFAIF